MVLIFQRRDRGIVCLSFQECLRILICHSVQLITTKTRERS